MGRAGRPSGENKIDFDPLRELEEEGLPPGWRKYWQGERDAISSEKEVDNYEFIRDLLSTSSNVPLEDVLCLPEIESASLYFMDNIDQAVDRYLRRVADATRGIMAEDMRLGVPILKQTSRGQAVEITQMDQLRDEIFDRVAFEVQAALSRYEGDLLIEGRSRTGERKITIPPPEICSSCKRRHLGDDCSAKDWDQRDYHYQQGEGIQPAPPKWESVENVHSERPLPQGLSSSSFLSAAARQDAWKGMRDSLATEITPEQDIFDLPEMQEAIDELIDSVQWSVDTYARQLSWSTEDALQTENRIGVLLQDFDTPLEVVNMELLREIVESRAIEAARGAADWYEEETQEKAERNEILVTTEQPDLCGECGKHHEGSCGPWDQRQHSAALPFPKDAQKLQELHVAQDGDIRYIDGEAYVKRGAHWFGPHGDKLSALQIEREI